MGIQKTASALLGIQPGEGRSAGLMLLHSFAMGTGTVFFETAASALFLAHFGSSLLPWVYIAAAVLNTLTGLAYSAVQERVPFARLMVTTLALLLAFTVSFRLGLFLTEAGWLSFGLLVFYRILSALTDLEYWAVATRLYDVRQAKRLFGMIGSGEVVARIAGAFSVPFLVARIGVGNLLIVSAAGIAACLALLLVVLGAGPAAATGGVGKKAKAKPAGGLRAMARLMASPYLGLLLSITFFGILAKYFVDFAFLDQMKSRFGEAKQLASFFGLFSGATQVLSLLTRVFVSGPVLSRFGIRVGLLVLPLAHAVCATLLVLEGTMAGSGAGAVFWLVIANQAVYKVLKHPIDNPSFKVLYQPLRPEQRLAAQIAVETIVTPITTGLAGLVMLLFTVVLPYHPVRFSYVMLLTFAGWVAVAVRAGRAYPAALTEALKGRIVDEELSFDDERSMAAVKEALRSEHPGDVVFALDLLERSGHESLGPVLAGLLDHPSPDVRGSVLARIERLRPAGALEAVARKAGADAVPAVRGAALRCLCALGGDDVAEQVVKALEDPDPTIQRAAMIGLLRQQGDAATSIAGAHLRSLAESPQPAKRASAAQVVADVGRGFEDVLRALLQDEAPSVRRGALAAVGRVKGAALWPLVVASLPDRGYEGPATRALVAGGEPVLPVLEAAWAREQETQGRVRIARVFGRIRGDAARRFLAERIDVTDEWVRSEVLEALRLCDYRAEEGAKERIHDALWAEAMDAAWELAALRDLGRENRLTLMRSALGRELAGNRTRVFLLLSFLHDPTAILRARDHLSDESKEKRAYALEILDVTLDRERKEMLLPILEELKLEERCERLDAVFPQARCEPHERLREILSRADASMMPWSRACAVYCAGVLRSPDLAAAVERHASAPEPLVRETAAWALGRLGRGEAAPGPAAAKGRRPMLAIEKVITLKTVPMFARASEDVLADIAAILEEMEVKSGEHIFEKGEVGDSLYIIVEGRVRVFDEERTITTLGERDIFGELALLDPEPRVASIAALADTKLLRLDREAFSELMAGNIEIVRGVLSVLCERLRKTTY